MNIETGMWPVQAVGSHRPPTLAASRSSETPRQRFRQDSGFATGSQVALSSLVAAAAARSCRSRRRSLKVLRSVKNADRTYLNVTGFPFPLGPIFSRRTVRKQIGDGMWTFEQEQKLANIAVNVRMTAIKLQDGGLWIHNPIAPTSECEALLRELGLPVKYIVLGSAQYEHKIFVAPFARRWPDAKVYTVPQQWSWPLDLPTAFYGIFSSGDLKDADTAAPWSAEIEQQLFNPKDRLGFGYSACECAFFHKRSKTLICTDALVYVPEEPPEVLDKNELRDLGKTAENFILDLVALVNWRGSGETIKQAIKEESSGPQPSEEALLRKGWQRDALLSLYFGPDGRSIVDPTQAFRAIAGKWIVGPVCYSLVYGGRLRQEVKEWSERLCQWDVQQILPGHFGGPIGGGRSDIQRAFEVLEEGVEATEKPEVELPWPFPQPVRYPSEDAKLLTDIRGVLQALKEHCVTPGAKVFVAHGHHAEIARLQSARGSRRQQRARDERQTIGLVGYTNVGKSAIVNRLTSSDLLVEDGVFVTLDVASRRCVLPSGRECYVLDSVGLIQGLPINVCEAVQATVQEMHEADVVLHVRDIAHPAREEQAELVREVLADAKIDMDRVVEVWNKADLVMQKEVRHLHYLHQQKDPTPVYTVSALTGSGFPKLLDGLQKMMEDLAIKAVPGFQSSTAVQVPQSGWCTVRMPQDLSKSQASDLWAFLHSDAAADTSVNTDEVTGEVLVTVRMSDSARARFLKRFGPGMLDAGDYVMGTETRKVDKLFDAETKQDGRSLQRLRLDQCSHGSPCRLEQAGTARRTLTLRSSDLDRIDRVRTLVGVCS
ncbi:hflX [Symbiodinium microadriaticum]|nr:hflX [Symbiodinium microadriaticum]